MVDAVSRDHYNHLWLVQGEVAQFSWARPHQLVKEPRLFVDGTSRRDVIQVRSQESLHLKSGHLSVKSSPTGFS